MADGGTGNGPTRDPVQPIPSERAEFRRFVFEGPAQPRTGHVKEDGRSFKPSWYETCSWLEYSLEKQAAFCFPCRAFGNQAPGCSGGTVDDKFTVVGFKNWKKALEKGRGFDRHGKSKAHLAAVSALKAYTTTKSIDIQLNEQQEQQLSQKQQRVQKNRAVISRLMSVTQLLGKCGAPFRGHDESESSHNRGLYKEVIAWGAQKDPVLANHLLEGPENAHYLSPMSQNDQIRCVGEEVKREVVDRVKKAKVFSVLMDETTDLSNKEQVCVMVRYVSVVDEGKATENITVEERLLSLDETKDTTGEHLTDLLLSKLKDSGLDVMDVVGQSYDGGANMRGKSKGVQARVQALNPRALYTYCYSHNLNRSLVNAVSAVEKKGEPTEARDCFAIVDLVYTFVEGSTARHALFLEAQEKFAEKGSRPVHLKGLSETRWNCRAVSLRRLKNPAVLQSIVSVVEEVKEKTADGVIRGTALGLLKSLRDPKFLVTLVALSPVMDLVDLVCCSLQSPQLDLLSAHEQIASLAKELSRWQTQATWDKILEEASKLGTLIDVDINGQDEPVRRPRKIPARLRSYECDGLTGDATEENMDVSNPAEGSDQLSESAKQMHRVFRVAEKLVTELERRFPSELGDFCILQRAHMFRDDADERLGRIASLYGLDLAELRSSWLLARNMIPPEKDLDIRAAYACLPKEFHALRWLYRIALTLPVTSAGVERRFSKLALLKGKLRTTMSQPRLEHLMLAFTESDIGQNLNMEKLVTKFARMGKRRIELL